MRSMVTPLTGLIAMAPASQRGARAPMRPAGVSRGRTPAAHGAVIRMGKAPALRRQSTHGHAPSSSSTTTPGFAPGPRLLLEAEGYEVVGEAADGAARARRGAPGCAPTSSCSTSSSPTSTASTSPPGSPQRRRRPAVVLTSSRDWSRLGRPDRSQRCARLRAEGPKLSGEALAELARVRSLRTALIGLGLVGLAAGMVSSCCDRLGSDHADDVRGRRGRLHAADRLVVHRHRPVRLVAAAREPLRRADDRGRLRLVPRERCSRSDVPGAVRRSAGSSRRSPTRCSSTCSSPSRPAGWRRRWERFLVGLAYFDTTVSCRLGVLFLRHRPTRSTAPAARPTRS